MSDIATKPTSDVLAGYAINKNAAAETAKKKTNELGQDAFLQLMITQMKNQDPLAPQSNSEFVAQLAQFSSVQGLEKLNTNFNNFSSSFNSNQALQASSLVGRSVSVETDTSMLVDKGIISGNVKLGSSTSDLKINIYDDKGALAAQVPVGTVPAGDTNFRFDGQNIEVNGELLDWTTGEKALPPGSYSFEVMASQNGKQEQLTTNLSVNVNSVTIGTDGKLVLNLAGVGPVDISKVKQFN
ncbi:MAG: flagellar hook assembly protein FlgD [Gammaproteobacteria bacterium]|nr:MAG: flagellar hook assembly protein FlgD [Gammaproteobacteria bacterium]